MNILVTTQMRTGSTWLCELLSEMIGKSWKFWSRGGRIPKRKFRKKIAHNKHLFVKMHHADPETICSQITTNHTKVISITRNIMDIIVSKAFYKRYDHLMGNKSSNKNDKKYVNDFCMSNQVVNEIKEWKLYNKNYTHPGYLLLQYEDMIKNTFKEMKKIRNFLGLKIKNHKLKEYIEKQSFQRKTGRKRGNEQRRAFRRKGIVGDYKNYLNKKSKDRINKLLNNL